MRGAHFKKEKEPEHFKENPARSEQSFDEKAKDTAAPEDAQVVLAQIDELTEQILDERPAKPNPAEHSVRNLYSENKDFGLMLEEVLHDLGLDDEEIRRAKEQTPKPAAADVTPPPAFIPTSSLEASIEKLEKELTAAGQPLIPPTREEFHASAPDQPESDAEGTASIEKTIPEGTDSLKEDAVGSDEIPDVSDPENVQAERSDQDQTVYADSIPEAAAAPEKSKTAQDQNTAPETGSDEVVELMKEEAEKPESETAEISAEVSDPALNSEITDGSREISEAAEKPESETGEMPAEVSDPDQISDITDDSPEISEAAEKPESADSSLPEDSVRQPADVPSEKVQEADVPLAEEPEGESEPEKTEPSEKKSGKAVRVLFDWLEEIVFAVVIVVVVFSFLFRVVTVQGTSMEKSFSGGDKLIVSSFIYKIQPGDVIVVVGVLDDPIIKRVIATAGQEVYIDNDRGAVFVDGVELDESAYTQNGITYSNGAGRLEFPAIVPENSVFVLGDNRLVSKDSRFADVGMISLDHVLGKAEFQVFPFSEIHLIR